MNQKLNQKKIIGREFEKSQIRACLKAKRNVLLEGPVGVGKTHLALSITEELNRPVFRIDGDQRYSEQKMTGWFDPPSVMKKGFTSETFMPGPLLESMQKGGILFINELNRLPDGVQNVLLPAIDERMLLIPRLGMVNAHENFLVIATQNPKEFVATSHLSEALLDRFELIVLDYQSFEDEVQMVKERLGIFTQLKSNQIKKLSEASILLIRMTRNHPKIRRGASIRAALSIAEISAVMIEEGQELNPSFIQAAILALPTRIEMEQETDLENSFQKELELLLKDCAQQALDESESGLEKKKI